MKLIFDERESSLHDMCMQSDIKIPIEKKVIPLGDILISNDDESEIYVYIERKSCTDLLASIKDGRYAEQSYRLSNCCPIAHNVIYLIEGMLPPKDKKLVISCIASLNYFKGFSVHRTVSMQESALYIMAFADKMCRDMAKGIKCPAYKNTMCLTDNNSEVDASYTSVVKVHKKANITVDNIGQLFLMQIPGISSTIASEIMKPFKTFLEFVDHVKQHPDYLDNVKIESNGKPRKIGSNVVKSIQSYVFGI